MVKTANGGQPTVGKPQASTQDSIGHKSTKKRSIRCKLSFKMMLFYYQVDRAFLARYFNKQN